MWSYDQPMQISYRFAAVTLSGGAATVGRFIGPKGLTGRLLSLVYIITTGVTVAAAKVTIDTSGTAGAYGVITVPIAAANSGGSATAAAVAAATVVPADTVINVKTDGAATAGAADITFQIGWF